MCCVEAGDLSPLAPMSIKDLIWVQTAQRLKAEEKYKHQSSLYDSVSQLYRGLLLTMADIRCLVSDMDTWLRLYATKGKGYKPFDESKLPSQKELALKREQEEKERWEKMSDEEKAAEEIKRYKEGKVYSPNKH